tara:strand:+ start:261 stop:623 length:363 start_codon:yes stop_codon:yes gene_type:complete
MSTNAIIRIEGIDFAQVYKHWDGYPQATLPWLKAFNEKFASERGSDPEYKLAQLLRSSAFEAKTFNLDDSKLTGWGLSPFQDPEKCGAVFVYTLEDNGGVIVHDVYEFENARCLYDQENR